MEPPLQLKKTPICSTLFTGGARSIMSSVGSVVTFFLDLDDLLAHRLVNPECRDVVALVQLDSDRIIKGPLKHWSACFPMAYSANLNGCVLNEGSGEILRRVTNLSLDNASLPISLFDQEFPHLFNLSVVGCKLTDAHLERFNCPNLTALDMTGCHTLTGTSLHMLNSDKLASLSLRSCFNITDVGLQGLQCPNLIYLNLMCVSGPVYFVSLLAPPSLLLFFGFTPKHHQVCPYFTHLHYLLLLGAAGASPTMLWRRSAAPT